jgi:hypothetical protein
MKEFEYYDDDMDEEESKDLGPELEEADLAALRKQCSMVLENKDAKVKDYIEGFIPICHELVLLEDKFTSDNEIYNENAMELIKLYKNHANALEGDQLHAYFCGYYQSVIEYLNQEQGLGSLIQHFDEAYNFSCILDELFSMDKEASDVLIGSIKSQDDFNAWKDYIVLLAETEE